MRKAIGTVMELDAWLSQVILERVKEKS
jgi:hypothetical protein